jgi:hypothetical protein
MRIILVVVFTALLTSGALAQNCRGMTPGPAKKACLQANPQFQAKKDRCKEEAISQGIQSKQGGAGRSFMQACMRRR